MAIKTMMRTTIPTRVKMPASKEGFCKNEVGGAAVVDAAGSVLVT
jgi:hypothetical protein